MGCMLGFATLLRDSSGSLSKWLTWKGTIKHWDFQVSMKDLLVGFFSIEILCEIDHLSYNQECTFDD